MERDLALFILRVGFGGTMLLFHGIPKIFNFVTVGQYFPDPLGVGSYISLGLAIFAEVICAILVIVGAGTRFAVIPLILTCLVWAFILQHGSPWVQREIALLYLIPFVTIIFAGPGKYSWDSSRKGRVSINVQN